MTGANITQPVEERVVTLSERPSLCERGNFDRAAEPAQETRATSSDQIHSETESKDAFTSRGTCQCASIDLASAASQVITSSVPSPVPTASSQGAQRRTIPFEIVDAIADRLELAEKAVWYRATGHLGDAVALEREQNRIDRIAQQLRRDGHDWRVSTSQERSSSSWSRAPTGRQTGMHAGYGGIWWPGDFSSYR